jgi:3-deoxy-D-manno-octulosonate 8-phosphate phosphatase (KDO 8-P phosphatase)
MADRAARIRLLALDVDGVLTDNGVYLGPVAGQRVELKRFDIQDGLGHTLLRQVSFDVAWVSGRFSEATSLRAAELRVQHLIQAEDGRKIPPMQALLDRIGIAWDEVAFVGDDLADLPVLARVGLPIAVANAVPEVKAVARHVTTAVGGHGAVREVIEWLLRARGQWDAALGGYLRSREQHD